MYLVPDLYLSVERKLQSQLHFQLQCLYHAGADGSSQRTLLRWSVEIPILLGISIPDPPSLLLFLFTEICSHHRTIQLFDHASIYLLYFYTYSYSTTTKMNTSVISASSRIPVPSSPTTPMLSSRAAAAPSLRGVRLSEGDIWQEIAAESAGASLSERAQKR